MNETLRKCVACNKPLEDDNHHCDPKDIQKKDTIRLRGREAVYLRDRGHCLTYGARLADGFKMLAGEN